MIEVFNKRQERSAKSDSKQLNSPQQNKKKECKIYPRVGTRATTHSIDRNKFDCHVKESQSYIFCSPHVRIVSARSNKMKVMDKTDRLIPRNHALAITVSLTYIGMHRVRHARDKGTY